MSISVHLDPFRCRFVSELSVSPLGIVCSFARPSSVILSFHLQAAQFFVYSDGPRGIVMSFHLKRARVVVNLLLWWVEGLKGDKSKAEMDMEKATDWLTDWSINARFRAPSQHNKHLPRSYCEMKNARTFSWLCYRRKLRDSVKYTMLAIFEEKEKFLTTQKIQ